MIDPVFILTIKLCLGVLFGHASWHKLKDPLAFSRVLDNYELTPGRLNQGLTWMIGITEAACAIALLTGLPEAAPIACMLLLSYTAAIGLKLAQGKRDIECGCSGPARRQLISGWLLARNGILLSAAMMLFLPARTRDLGWLDNVQILCGVLTSVLLYITLEQMLANHSRLTSYHATLEGQWKQY